MPNHRIIIAIIACLLFTASSSAQDDVPPIRVVYFTPADRTPPPERHARLGRVMRNIQDFYRSEMQANGHGPMAFALEWETPENLRLYDVRGARNLVDYPKGTEQIVYDEVREALRQRGIDMQREFVLILGAFLERRDGITVEYGPFAGFGNATSGWAFACDDTMIDADLMASREPGGHHHRVGPCSIGYFSSRYIGGIAHELGHAFGLPHDCQRDAEIDTRGYSLMGLGNQHYGKSLYGEGPGAFLTAASALRLSVCRAFDHDFTKHPKDVRWNFENLDFSFHDGKIIATGRSTADAPRGIIVANNNENIPQDYDAKTWTAIPDAEGRFRLEIDELQHVPYELRFVAVFPGGVTGGFEFRYTNESGTPTLEAFYAEMARREINASIDRRDWNKTAELLAARMQKFPKEKDWARKLRHLETVKNPPAFFDPAAVSDIIKTIDLTYARALEEKVGWLTPSRGILRECGFLEVDGTFFESGIYARAFSNYTFSLGKKWDELRFHYGIQDGKTGTVVFVVRADGREIFRSRTVTGGEILFKRLDVSDVDKLELITEDAGDGTANDWGLWLRPEVTR